MECNKDEATRAKEIAEKKFLSKDIPGAKKFALKAQSLYPGLEGISQMLGTFDVYISAENKICGEADWYGILGVSPTADDEMVRKQYRKLALMLHPDKNKTIGADGAFKLISEAWSLLSDKAKRVAYDQKRNIKTFQKAPTSSGVSSASSRAKSFYQFGKCTNTTTANANTTAKTHKNADRARHSSHKTKSNTFWTVCHRCKMQYEYLRVYLNHNLLCPNCQKPFFAIEISPPPSDATKSSMPWNFSQQQQSTNRHASNKDSVGSGRSSETSSRGVGGFGAHHSNVQNNFHWAPFSKTSGSSTAAQAASVVQQAYEKVKREREEAQAATKREEALRKKQASKRSNSMSSTGYANAAKRRRGWDDVSGSNMGREFTGQMGMESGAMGASASKQANFGAVSVKGAMEMSPLQLQKILMFKARRDIRKKLDEWRLTTATETAGKGERAENDDKAGETTAKGSTDDCLNDKSKLRESVHAEKGAGDNESFPGIHTMDAETLDMLSMTIPDPDFHDFDKDRTEKSFGENQVWAVYDDDDGMPRYYAMIHNVISLNPFRIRISWLNSKTNTELGPLNWVGSGFSKTCGDFRVGKYEIYSLLNAFSHKVRWTKGTCGVIHIYPRKGDVWALYRHWSPDWNELTADETIHKYDMVEVLQDCDEEQGVLVTPLVKVARFKAVFHRHLDLREVRRIPREEMFRFSHQVPSYLLSGHEAPNAPRGCLELDPGATPLDLLQVITDVKEEDTSENEEKETLPSTMKSEAKKT